MRVHLKGVKKVTTKLATGETKLYYYAWSGGPRLEGEPGSAEFLHSYAAAHQARKRPSQGTLFSLISEFKASAEFAGKSTSTQRNYQRYLRLIEEEFGDLPLRALLDPEVRGELKCWRDKLAHKPRTADYAWATLARVLSFAKDRGRITVNPFVTTGPNISGYGSRSVSTLSSGAASSGLSASSGGAGAVSPSIPPCSSEPPFNELCN